MMYGRLLASEGEYDQPMQQADTDYRAQLLAAEDPGYYGTSQTGYNQALKRQDAGVGELPVQVIVKDTTFSQKQVTVV
jgi:outer membrane translocation and assembly module TamA